MPIYRVFFLAQHNRVALPAEAFEAADDLEAVIKARIKRPPALRALFYGTWGFQRCCRDKESVMPKNDITRSRGEYPGEAGADWELGATAKPEANEHRGRQHHVGLAGPDRQQGDLRDPDRGTYSQPKEDHTVDELAPRQDAQHGANVRGRASMVHRQEDLPEGLVRERKGQLDKNLGRNEAATQVPRNWNPKDGM